LCSKFLSLIKKSIIIFFGILCVLYANAQNLGGYIFDETNAGVPFVNVYVKNLGMGTVSDGEGKYFLRFNDPGVYEIVFSSIGYEKQEIKVIFKGNEDQSKNIWLKIDQNELDEIVVNSKRRDPAYEIIANAIDHKNKWLKQFESSTCDVYIKAKEVISEKEQKRREKEAENTIKEIETSLEEDVFDAEKKKNDAAINKIASSMNMAEIQMKRHFQYPNQIKEIREGYKKLGNTYGLFFTHTSESEFNFLR
jgi:hypothetical protein